MEGSSFLPLHIEMPQNKLVFENFSALVYDSLWNHFDRVGYHLTKENGSGYTLKITIKDVGSAYKFLSPDLMMYNVRKEVKLLCELFDDHNHLKAKKLFSFSIMIPKSKDYVVNSSFSDFKFRRLFERYAHKVDQYLRPFLRKKVIT